MFQSGKYAQAAAQFEAIAARHGQGPAGPARRAVGSGRAGLDGSQRRRKSGGRRRAEALELKTNDPDLWVDRGLSYAAMQAWPRAISDFDRAMRLRQDDVEVLVLRAAAWRNARDPGRALDDVNRACRSRPTIPRRCSSAASPIWPAGSRDAANADFNRVLKLGAAGLARRPSRRGGPRGERRRRHRPTPAPAPAGKR